MTPPELDETRRQRLQNIRHVALDMDGTIYCGDRLFEDTLSFFDKLRCLGIGWTFLTNNSSKSAEQYVRHLAGLGIEAGTKDILISSHATIELIKRNHPEVRSIFAAGSTGLHCELERAGFTVVASEAPGEPDAVLIGFDPHLDYSVLCKAAYWVKMGLPYFATHPDQVCPTNLPTILVDCGAICAAIECATGRKPDAIGGKPQPDMIDALGLRLNLPNQAIAMIGDRLYTDILMAKRSGALGVLTLTGETQRDDLVGSAFQPDLVVESLTEFAALLSFAQSPSAQTKNQ